jgi:hypothetical protein
MKVIHIIDEISEKNRSIYSVAKFYCNKIKNSNLLSNENKQKPFLGNADFFLNSKFYNFFFYFNKLNKFFIKDNFQIIHIHGLWRPVYFFSILYSKIYNKPIIVQPHGMMLDPALRLKGKINFSLKIFLISIYSKILKINNFIAVTSEEKNQIKKFFPKSKIKIIPNPIEVKNITKRIQKKIIFMGRFNKIKNLKLCIESFAKSNFSQNIYFEIYGIDDDELYKKEIEELIRIKRKNNIKIFIKKPVYGKLKNEVIAEAWLNILLSDSEVLSLSVQEAGLLGTPSLVNRQIYFPNWISRLNFKTLKNIKDIRNKINQILSLTLIQRKKLGNKIKKNFTDKLDNEKLINSLDKVYKGLKQNDNIKVKKHPFRKTIFYSSIFSLNFFVYTYIMFIYALLGRPETSAEIAIYSGTLFLILQLISGNARQLILFKNNSYNLYVRLRNYILILGFIFIIILRIYDLINELNFYLMLIVLLNWTNEIKLTYLEKNNSKNLLIFFMVISIFFYSLMLLTLIKNEYLMISILKIYLTVIFGFFIFLYDFSLKIKNTFKIFNNLKNISPFLSSASIILSILAWRFFIYQELDNALAGYLFVAFSIGSFPGTFMNSILAPTLLNNLKVNFRRIFNYVLFYILITFAIILFIDLENKNIDALFSVSVIFSLVGGVLTVYSSLLRNYLIRSKKFINIFFYDVVNSLFVASIPIIIYLTLNGLYLVYAYYIASIISTLFYGYYIITKNKKII